MRNPFNPEMLVMVREAAGLTQKDLAGVLGLTQGAISRIESGLNHPTPEVVTRIAAALKRPRHLFFHTDTFRASAGNCTYYRKRKTTPVQTQRQVLAIANLHRVQVSRLILSGNVEPETTCGFQRFDLDEHPPERIAQTTRASWGLPPGPVASVIRSVEDAGGIVIKCEFGTRKIDALSQWSNGLPPIFIVNEGLPADRMRFSLAHELGHVLMHQSPTEDIEKEADRFASEFLMPEKQVRVDLRDGLSLPRLAALKPHWKVSMAALLKRAGDLALVTPSQRDRLWRQLSPYRMDEPVPLPPEDPKALADLMRLHREDLGFTESELHSLLFLNENTDPRFQYRENRGGLRLVG